MYIKFEILFDWGKDNIREILGVILILVYY